MSCVANLVSYLDSNWVASDLPIIYGITNDKWPINNTDGIGSVTAISDENGFARVTLASTVGGFADGIFVKISGASISGYNGVWRVRQAFSPTDFIISSPYLGTDTASIQRYYNNYHIIGKVYTGIRNGHTLASERPMEYRGSVRVRPDGSNLANLDISSFVRSDISPIDNRFCELDFTSGDGWANDSGMWTQFYIEFAESYDVVNDGVLETFVSGYTQDTYSDGSLKIYSAVKAANSFQYAQGKSMAEYAINPFNYDGSGRFMVDFESPSYFPGYQWDLAIINDYQNSQFTLPAQMWIVEYDGDGSLLNTSTYDMPEQDEGVYRFDMGSHSFTAGVENFICFVKYDRDTYDYNTRNLTVKYVDPCGKSQTYLRWMNQHGGWNGWLFFRNRDQIVDIQEKVEVRRDIYSNWDTEFTFGKTQDDVIKTVAFEKRVVRSNLLNEDEAKILGRNLRLSVKVLEIFPSDDTDCGNDEERTVLIPPGEFTYVADGTRVREVVLNYRYTDEILVPRQ